MINSLFIKVIASSSKGNSYIISDGTTTLLIECGLSLKQLKRRTKYIVPSSIDACLITHYHQDHSKALKDMLNAGVDCYALKETFEAKGVSNHYRAKIIKFGDCFMIGTLTIVVLEMKHDVPCCGFYIHSTVTDEYLLFATDTYLIKTKPAIVNYIMIEANYDVRLVEDDEQKNRLFKSHMSIDTTIQYLKSIDLSNVLKIYLMHLSSRHSNEEDFKKRVQAATGVRVVVCEE
ncbi:MAG: MBL fold metallo-hydrolase [Coprobacillus sp.]|nr:MBL fold metallo-hydrolase [Coprobacillus sp.]